VIFDCEDDVEWCACNKINYDRDHGATELNNRLNVFHAQQTCEEVHNCEPTLPTGCIPTRIAVLSGTVMGEYTNYPCNAGSMAGGIITLLDITPSLFPYTQNNVTYGTPTDLINAHINAFQAQSFSVPGLYKNYTMSVILTVDSGDCFANLDLCDAATQSYTDLNDSFDSNGDPCCQATHYSGRQLGYCSAAVNGQCGCIYTGSGTPGDYNIVVTPYCNAPNGGVWSNNQQCETTDPPCGIRCSSTIFLGGSGAGNCTTCGGNSANNYYAQGTDHGYWKDCCITASVSGC